MLLTDQVLFADIAECQRKKGKVFYEDDNWILIESPTSHMLYCAAKNEMGAKAIVKHLPKMFSILVAHDKLTDTYLQRERGLTCTLRCYHSAYLKKDPPHVIVPTGYQLRLLKESHIDEIIALYQHSMPSLATHAYIKQCLQDDIYGIFKHEDLCGFIGVHEEESIELLEVKEKYRRKGLAVSLLQQMVKSQMKKGRIPYGEIVEDNESSLHLQKKAGMETSAALTYWYFME